VTRPAPADPPPIPAIRLDGAAALRAAGGFVAALVVWLVFSTPYERTLAGAAELVIRAFERRYLSALLERSGNNVSSAARAAGVDRSNFRRTLAPGFVYSENDRTYTREEVLRDLLSPSDTISDARNEQMSVHLFGSTAVVTGWLIVRGRGSSGSFERRYRFTDTWARQAGRWRIVAAHDFLAPPR